MFDFISRLFENPGRKTSIFLELLLWSVVGLVIGFIVSNVLRLLNKNTNIYLVFINALIALTVVVLYKLFQEKPDYFSSSLIFLISATLSLVVLKNFLNMDITNLMFSLILIVSVFVSLLVNRFLVKDDKHI